MVEAIIKEIKEWYWNSDVQTLAKDPCVIDAMIDMFIRTLKKYENKYIATFEPVKLGSCANCEHYHREVRDGIEFFNFNYCKKGVSTACPNFFCAYYEEGEEC